MWCVSAIVDVDLDSSSESQAERDAVVDDGVDKARGNALMFFADGVGEDDRRSREGHVHSPRDHDRTDESLGPVGLIDWHCGHENVADGEGGQGNHHHPRRTEAGEENSGDDSGDCSRHGSGTLVCDCEQG